FHLFHRWHGNLGAVTKLGMGTGLRMLLHHGGPPLLRVPHDSAHDCLELKLRPVLSWVRVRQGDTDSPPFDEGPRASRVTYTEGHAVMQACARMRQAMHDGATLPLTMTVAHEAPQPADVMYFSAQVAEVDVDRETGQVKVIKVVTAHDVGTVINSLAHQGQIDGGFVTGLGLAVTEELVSEGGQILNGHLGEYKLPTIADIPPLETVLVQTGGGEGPYQAKAIGELANNATAAATREAAADAVGCRLFELPITAERVYAALHQV